MTPRFISTLENGKIVSALVTSLRDLPIGEILARKQIANLISGKPHLLYRAMRIVEEEDGVIFATIIREGVKKLHAQDTHALGERTRRSVGRKVGHAKRRIVCVLSKQADVLNAQERQKIAEEANKLGLIAEFC